MSVNFKSGLHAIDSPKKRMDKVVLFAFLLFTANKSNSSVHFLGESMAHKSAFQFHLTFKLAISEVSNFGNQLWNYFRFL